MRNLLIVLTLVFSISVESIAQKNADVVYRGQVKFDSSPAIGTVAVISTGFSKKKAASIKDAFSNAFYALLFRGIPGSQYELPMIADESKKDNPFVAGLLDGSYSSYVTDSQLQLSDEKSKGPDGAKGVQTTYKITINCDALRRSLEQNNIIRKFGI